MKKIELERDKKAQNFLKLILKYLFSEFSP
jgi:hypothetical protein